MCCENDTEVFKELTSEMTTTSRDHSLQKGNQVAGDNQVAGALLRLYINCEIISGPGLRTGSSEKNVAPQVPQGDVQGPLVGSVLTGDIKEAHDKKELLRKEQKAMTEEVQKREEHLTAKGVPGLGGTKHERESKVLNFIANKYIQVVNPSTLEELRSFSQYLIEMRDMLFKVCQQDESSKGGLRDESSKASLGDKFSKACLRDKSSKAGLRDESSKACLRDESSKAGLRDESSKVLNVIALKYFHTVNPSTPEELNGFLQYLRDVRNVRFVAAIQVAIPRPFLQDESSKGGLRDESSKAGLRDVSLKTGLRDEFSKAGLRDEFSKAGLGDESSKAGLRDEFSKAGLGDESSKAGLREESSKAGLGDESSNVLNFIASTPEECNDFLKYLRDVGNVHFVDEIQGSLIIILECATLEILEGLWEDYNTGHICEVVQNCLVTDDILEEFGEVKLTTAILEDDYRACRDYFFQFSGGSEVTLSTTGKRKKPVSALRSLDNKRMKMLNYAGNTSPEGVSEDAIETATKSQAKSKSKMTAELSHDTLETETDFFSEKSIETVSCAESERCEVSERGAIWKLQDIQAAACLTFPPNALTKPVLFRCIVWTSTTQFPPLKKNEALVSSVIVLTFDDPHNSNFTGKFDEKVSVALSHSASNLKGYEVVIRELVDVENNEWKDLETTNIWKSSDIQCGPSSTPNIPFAEAKVTCCSAFAVVCRLKSYTYSTNALGNCDFTCKVQEYPDLSVTIPASAVRENREFVLTLKAQEIPRQWFDDSRIIVGPVLHITCSPIIQLLEPATITVPISLYSETIVSADFSSKNVRVIVKNEEETSDWKEITDQLPRPADFANGVVTFQATHFTLFSTLLEKLPFLYWPSIASHLSERVPLEAGFFACLCSSGSREDAQLRFCCYPIHMESQVRKNICSTYEVVRYGNGSSSEPLCQDDIIFVTLLKGLEASEDTSEEDLQLRFLADKKFERDVVVRHPYRHVPQIEFFKQADEKPPRDRKLCKLSIVPPSTGISNTQRRPVKTGNPSKDELEELSTELGDKWEKLGRRLGFKQPTLTAFHKQNESLSDKALRMLFSWKERGGSNATYQVLYDALSHDLVGCTLLAEDYCCNLIC